MSLFKLLLAVPLMSPAIAFADPSAGSAAAPVAFQSGCYIGVTGGYVVGGRSQTTNSVNVSGRVFAAQPSDNTLRGPAGGGDVGCNIRTSGNAASSSFVFGPEVEIWAQNVHGTSDIPNLRSPGETIRSSVKSTLAGAATVRIGYAFNNFFLYGKGGAAMTTFKHQGYIFDNASGATVDVTNDTHHVSVGYLVGGGAEIAFDRHWSVKLEYNYINYGSVNATYQISLDPGLPTAALLSGPSRAHETEQFLKTGLLYRF